MLVEAGALPSGNSLAQEQAYDACQAGSVITELMDSRAAAVRECTAPLRLHGHDGKRMIEPIGCKHSVALLLRTVPESDKSQLTCG